MKLEKCQVQHQYKLQSYSILEHHLFWPFKTPHLINRSCTPLLVFTLSIQAPSN